MLSDNQNPTKNYVTPLCTMHSLCSVPPTWNAVLIAVFSFVVLGQPLRDLSIAGNMAHRVEQLQEHK